MNIYARRSLVPTEPAADPSLLLEGDWPASERAADRWSLDETIDARHAWIDVRASELAEQLADQRTFQLAGCGDVREASLAWINALALRYYFVKLLRAVAFFDLPLRDDTARIELYCQSGRDDDYRLLFDELASKRGWDCRQHSVRAARRIDALPCIPNGWPRRTAGELNRRLDALCDLLSAASSRRVKQAPVLLCGNPRVLSPICGALKRRQRPVRWLYDRFAFGAWLQRRPRGERQLVCNASLGEHASLTSDAILPLLSGDIDLSSAVEPWLRDMAERRAGQQQRLWKQIEGHIRQTQPEALVLDEDATPIKRIAVAVARRQGVPSVVVQHGAPRVRFGFAPLVADRFLAWGKTSVEQLVNWGVSPERIESVGSLAAWPALPAVSSSRSIVLFATVPPNDARPDAVSYHLTRSTHDRMIELACTGVARLKNYELVIKLHPRASDHEAFSNIAAAHDDLRFRLVRNVPTERLLAEAACVLNCGSSAGIEAASYGIPVIELLPAGSIELTPAKPWGMLGAACDAPSLERLLQAALAERSPRRAQPQSGDVFAAIGAQAAERATDAILDLKRSNSQRSSRVAHRPLAEASV